MSLLGSAKIIAFVYTSDPVRAKAFYGDTLGLRFVSQDEFAVVFDANGTMLRVGIVQGKIAPARHTIVGWAVADIVSSAKALQSAGVELQHYPWMPPNELGIWTAPSGDKVAWFTDPEGNVLSISQHVK